ncbi:unnamed protein product [Rotaria socialis]|uniref:Cysteine-rich protein 1 n=2 Tax=Rotaria socialis TaxID=392032 RepID=A0A818HSQ5_9BILA|nr:unnamed protein product [Rotaria socialis]CAF3513823.1 unnamed protein product [Rotaria socialis]CAF3598877.1 unnamed protein product [Rotaria socialis]CAF4332542.1 unnamed protein product [Rotaria socialis]CAF4351618.1 unnamed protein product [Rotaria socialis]
MRRRTEFKTKMRCMTSSSSSPRFSRTFDLLLSQFPDLADLSIKSTLETSPIMASTRNSSQSLVNADRSNAKPGQWRASISAPLCAFCNKSVYPAEELIAAGQKFHKLCLKCVSCNTILNLGNFNEREKKIYCSGCYRRQHGPRTVGFGIATTLTPSLDTPPTSPDSNQEEIDSISGLTNTDDDNTDRNTPVNSSPSHASSDNDYLRSSIPYPGERVTRQTLPTVNRPTAASVVSGAAFKMMSISGNICPRCSKTVYSAEEVKAVGKSFHKRCYTCANCKGTISGAHFSERDGELYDNKCYQRLFGPRGII